MSSPGGGGRAGALRDCPGVGTRSDHRHRPGQRDLLPRGQRLFRTVSQARLPSDRPVRYVRRRPTSRAGCSDSMRNRWRAPPASAAASPPGCSNAGWMARRRNSCTRDGRRRAESPPRSSRVEGMTGPAQVFEGRLGLFASHVQDAEAPRDFGRMTDELGTHWESRNSSFKPFPAAHVIHPYISAAAPAHRAGVRIGRCGADRLSGAGVHRVDCLRADG